MQNIFIIFNCELRWQIKTLCLVFTFLIALRINLSNRKVRFFFIMRYISYVRLFDEIPLSRQPYTYIFSSAFSYSSIFIGDFNRRSIRLQSECTLFIEHVRIAPRVGDGSHRRAKIGRNSLRSHAKRSPLADFVHSIVQD